MRIMQVENPHTYKSNLSHGVDHTWKIRDQVQVVNGVVEKSDGTFLQGFFMSEITEHKNPHNIILGSYPLYEVDVKSIAVKSRATAVMSLQSDYELAQRGVNEDQIVNWYR